MISTSFSLALELILSANGVNPIVIWWCDSSSRSVVSNKYLIVIVSFKIGCCSISTSISSSDFFSWLTMYWGLNRMFPSMMSDSDSRITNGLSWSVHNLFKMIGSLIGFLRLLLFVMKSWLFGSRNAFQFSIILSIQFLLLPRSLYRRLYVTISSIWGKTIWTSMFLLFNSWIRAGNIAINT